MKHSKTPALYALLGMTCVAQRVGSASFVPMGGVIASTSPTTSSLLRFFTGENNNQNKNKKNQRTSQFLLKSVQNGVLPITAEESIMRPKSHGTSESPVQKNLRWNCDVDTADRICNFNRHYAEYSGYWQSTNLLKSINKDDAATTPIQFYDSVTGKLLFTAPVGRTLEEFIAESKKHGWPSFRDEEVNWEYVRCLKNGECVSTTGTHLGHNLPDKNGNRYCINLVSVAGQPVDEE